MSNQHQPQDPGQPAGHPEAVPSVQHDGGELHAEPGFHGITAPMFISLAMIAVIALMIWKKVPGAVGRALDAKIALIRNQLSEAEALRKEAEALKAEYEAKAASADKDREALLDRARHEATEIVANAHIHAEALVERRTRMAEDKIAAEERSAIEQLRATAADAATRAAARIIAERHDAATDDRLVDQAIREIASR
ncbi:F-type H+-transporting ATPase subunit b [Sphingomonas sp. F9_3S_D5_B_2]